MFCHPQEIFLTVLTVTLGGLVIYKLFGPTYPWEIIKTEQYLSELVENVTQGIEKTQQSEIPIPDIILSFPETGTSFQAKSGSVFDMSSLEPIDYNLVSRNKTCQVIELRTQLKTFQVSFQQYKSKVYNNTHKGKIVASVSKNVIKTYINCMFVSSCVCKSDIGSTVIEDITDISVGVRGAEDDSETTEKITNWVINHIVSNVKHTIESSIEESIKRFSIVRHLKCI